MSSRHVKAFTLMEAVVVLLIMSILLAIGVVGFASTRKSQADMSGLPLLGAVQTQGRKIATTNNYRFPAESLRQELTSRGLANVSFTSGASHAPEEGSDEFEVSVVTAPTNPAIVGYAVETTPGNCLVLLDRTTATGTDKAASLWVKSINTPDGGCMAILDCESAYAASTGEGYGTAESPKLLTAGLQCSASNAAPPTPTCLVADVDRSSGTAVVRTRWDIPSDRTGITGYRVQRYNGTPNFPTTNAANTSVNVLDQNFALAKEVNGNLVATTGPGVTLSESSENPWEGAGSYELGIPSSATKDQTLIESGLSAAPAGPSAVLSVAVARSAATNYPLYVKPRIEWYDASNTKIGEAVGAGATVSQAWRTIRVSDPAKPAGAVKARVSLMMDNSTGSLPGPVDMYADAFVLEAGTDVTPPATITPDATFDVAGPETAAFVDTTAVPGAVYTYAVLSLKGTTTSNIADLIASQLVLPTINMPPAQIGSITETQPAKQQQIAVSVTRTDRGEAMVVVWAGASGATRYKIQRKLVGAPDSAYDTLGYVNAPDITYTDSSVTYGATYTYKVTGVNDGIGMTICGQQVNTDATGEGVGGTNNQTVRPNPPVVDGRVDVASRANLISFTSVDPSANAQYEVSVRSPEAGAWSPARLNSATPNTWLPCASDPAAADTLATSCLYGGPAATNAAGVQLAHQNESNYTSVGAGVPVRKDSQVIPGSRLSYRVRTVLPNPTDATKYVRSCWSNENYVQASNSCVDNGQTLTLTQPLDAPDVTATTNASAGTSTLTWPVVPGADAYVVYRRNGVNATFPAGGPTNLTTLEWGDVNTTSELVGTYGSIGGRSDNISATPGLVTYWHDDGSPSQQTYKVFAIRKPTAVVSAPGDAITRMEPTAPQPSCTDSSTTVPITWSTAGLSSNTAIRSYQVWAFSGAGDTTGTQIAGQADNGTGTAISRSTSSYNYSIGFAKRFIFKTRIVYDFNGGVQVSGFSNASGMCGTPFPAMEASTFFTDYDNNGLSSDQTVIVTPPAGGVATHYAFFLSDTVTGSTPIDAVANATLNGGTAFRNTSAGVFVNPDLIVKASAGNFGAYTTVAPYPAGNPACPSCVGKVTVTGTDVLPAAVAAQSAQLLNRQVFSAPGVYKTYHVLAFALNVNATTGAIVDGSSARASAQPAVTAPEAVTALRAGVERVRDGAGWETFSPYARWSMTGKLADWLAQPYALSRVRVTGPGLPAAGELRSLTFDAQGRATGVVGSNGWRVAPPALAGAQRADYRVSLLAVTPSGTVESPQALAQTRAPAARPNLSAVLNDSTAQVTLAMSPTSGRAPDAYRAFMTSPSAGLGAGSEIGNVTTNTATGQGSARTQGLNRGMLYNFTAVSYNYKTGNQSDDHALQEGYSSPADPTYEITADKSRNEADYRNSIYVELKQQGVDFGRGFGGAGSGRTSMFVKGLEGYCIDFSKFAPAKIGAGRYRGTPDAKDMGSNFKAKALYGPTRTNYSLAALIATFGATTNRVDAAATAYLTHKIAEGTAVSKPIWNNMTAAERQRANAIEGWLEPYRGPYTTSVSGWGPSAAGTTKYVTVNTRSNAGNGIGGSWVFAAPTNGWVPAPAVSDGGGNAYFPTTPQRAGAATLDARVLSVPRNLWVWRPTDGNPAGQRLVQAGLTRVNMAAASTTIS